MKGRNTSQQIMANAKELFFAYGLRSVSMDDLASLSGVSKKTIYQHYEDKDVLVHAVVTDLVQIHERLLVRYQSIAKDAIDELLTIDTRLFGIWTDIRPGFFYEVEKFFPESWRVLEYYTLKIRNFLIGNLERGKKEGHYRNDINTVLIVELSMHQHISLLRSQFASTQRLSTELLAKEITMLHLRSITTEMGNLLLDKYIKNKIGE